MRASDDNDDDIMRQVKIQALEGMAQRLRQAVKDAGLTIESSGYTEGSTEIAILAADPEGRADRSIEDAVRAQLDGFGGYLKIGEEEV